jgi:hypothetical protein
VKNVCHNYLGSASLSQTPSHISSSHPSTSGSAFDSAMSPGKTSQSLSRRSRMSLMGPTSLPNPRLVKKPIVSLWSALTRTRRTPGSWRSRSLPTEASVTDNRVPTQQAYCRYSLGIGGGWSTDADPHSIHALAAACSPSAVLLVMVSLSS